MQYIARCAQITSGTINILNPLELMRQIRLIAQNPVIATGVEVTFFLHPALRFDRATDSQVGDPDAAARGGSQDAAARGRSQFPGQTEVDPEKEAHLQKVGWALWLSHAKGRWMKIVVVVMCVWSV